MDYEYPWSVLAIAPTDDQKAIRKAYAVKLKQTRPDEDPDAFQALVEARDRALFESRFAVYQGDGDVEEQTPPRLLHDITCSEASPAIPAVAEPDRVTGQVSYSDSAEVGEIEPPRTDMAVAPAPKGEDDGQRSKVESLLSDVGTPQPWQTLQGQWAKVFDALEACGFDDYFGLMFVVLNRLVEDLRSAVGTLPDAAGWKPQTADDVYRLLYRYEDILRDLEARFQFLKQDTMLLDYLEEEDAMYLVNALTLAVGRVSTAQDMPQRPEINVRVVDRDLIDAAFASDKDMRDYYAAAVENDRYGRSFSIWALLFPLPTALYYRLNSLAGLFAVIIGVQLWTRSNAVFGDVSGRAANKGYAGLASIVYIVVALVFAFQWRRLRIQAAIRQVGKLAERGDDRTVLKGKLGLWGQPSRAWLGVGMLFLVIAMGFRFHLR